MRRAWRECAAIYRHRVKPYPQPGVPVFGLAKRSQAPSRTDVSGENTANGWACHRRKAAAIPQTSAIRNPRTRFDFIECQPTRRSFIVDPEPANFTTWPISVLRAQPWATLAIGNDPYRDADARHRSPSKPWLCGPNRPLSVWRATTRSSLQRRFPHVHVCADAGKTGGLYGAINATLAAAPAEWQWFTYINDDDRLLPGFSAMFARQLAGEPADVIYGDVELIDEDGERVSRITTERRPTWIPALLQQGISPLMQQGICFAAPSGASAF